MSLSTLLPKLDDVVHTTTFFQFIESHLAFIIKNHIAETRTITEAQGHSYRGDFYGLLTALGFSHDTHYVIMRINGLNSSFDYDGKAIFLSIPKMSEITSLRNVFNTKLS